MRLHFLEHWDLSALVELVVLGVDDGFESGALSGYLGGLLAERLSLSSLRRVRELEVASSIFSNGGEVLARQLQGADVAPVLAHHLS